MNDPVNHPSHYTDGKIEAERMELSIKLEDALKEPGLSLLAQRVGK